LKSTHKEKYKLYHQTRQISSWNELGKCKISWSINNNVRETENQIGR